MPRLGFLALLLLVPFPASAAEPAARHDGDLLFLGIALNQAPDKANGETVDVWNFCARDLAALLRENGKSVFHKVQTQVLLGRQATYAHIMAGLGTLARSATRKDLVVLYIGCHGGTEKGDGWGFDSIDHQTVWGRDVKSVLGQVPCPVVAIIETCGSGGFARPHRKDIPLPPNVTALCACRALQETDNHLSVAVSEALSGKADFNKDGLIQVGELLRYTARRHRELVPGGKVGKDSELPLLVPAAQAPLTLPLTTVSTDIVAVAARGEWYQARLIEEKDGTFQVRVLGWDNKPGPYFVTDSVNREHVCLSTDPSPVQVELNGTWRPARLLEKDGDRLKVHYIGTRKRRDEYVPRERVRFLFATESEESARPARP
jgi:hypothetical protein